MTAKKDKETDLDSEVDLDKHRDTTSEQTGLDPDRDARGGNPFVESAEQDDPVTPTAAADAPHTSQEALANARKTSENDVFVGSGYCLRAVRTFFGIAPLYPDAETAWEEAEHKHKVTDPDNVPRGRAIFWVNGGFGHVALSAGGGRCWTTDYHRRGYVDLAPISVLDTWCGGRFVGYADDLNGVRYWQPRNRKPEPAELDLKFKLDLVNKALERALENDNRARVRLLREWRARLRERLTD